MNKHPNHEFILAYLAGKVVQQYSPTFCEWKDLPSLVEQGFLPAFHNEEKFRVKPVKKPNIEQFVIIDYEPTGWKPVKVRTPEHWELGNLKVTFDGDTKEVLSVELLK